MSGEAAEVRAALDALGPAGLAERLGLRFRAVPGGLRAACPVHGGDNPGAFAMHERRGTLLFACHVCGAKGDALSLVAALEGLDPRRDFPQVVARGAELAGIELDASAPRRAPPKPRAQPEPEPPRYPDRDEVATLWDRGRHALSAPVSGWLRSRGLDGAKLHRRGLVVALDAPAVVNDLDDAEERAAIRAADGIHADVERRPLPSWAKGWGRGGWLALLPLWDVAGVRRSLRVRRVVDGDGPKALAPKGFNVAGLVLASLPAVRWLRGFDALSALIVVEGETDFLSAAAAWPDAPVLGLVSGASWTSELAAKVPSGARVLVNTDPDETGERYAADIAKTLEGRAKVERSAGLCRT